MTSKLRAGRTFSYKLESERDDAEADVFQLNVLSGESDLQVGDMAKQFIATADTSTKREIVAAMIKLTIHSWPWDGSLQSVVTEREVWELIGAAREGASLTAEERKKFVLPPSCETG